uniref:Uncharacterized protein n=1 Tax=viral metagenome TaxID=1070528 RepID=A0A6C0AC92_9ZZZZ
MNFNINSNILFYSNYSQQSQNLLRILQNDGLINFFVPICVDDKLDKLPKDLIVPSMKIKGTNKFWVAEETFEWVKQAKFVKNVQKRNFINNLNQKDNLLGYNKLEHGSKSDIFTFVDDKIDFMSQDYVGHKDKGNIILTPPKEKNGEKMKKKDQDDLIKKIDNLRKQQDNQFKQASKEEIAKRLALQEMNNK